MGSVVVVVVVRDKQEGFNKIRVVAAATRLFLYDNVGGAKKIASNQCASGLRSRCTGGLSSSKLDLKIIICVAPRHDDLSAAALL